VEAQAIAELIKHDRGLCRTRDPLALVLLVFICGWIAFARW
jgi:hypothetical protein